MTRREGEPPVVETVLLALLLAKLRGNRLRPFWRSGWFYPIFAADLFSVFLNVQIILRIDMFLPLAGVIKAVYMSLYILPLIRYRLYGPGLAGAGCILAGTAMNKIVMAANGGRMPVYPTLSRLTGYFDPALLDKPDSIHMLGGADTQLKFLTDYLDIGYSVLSIGDLFIRAFVVLIVFYAVKAMQAPSS